MPRAATLLRHARWLLSRVLVRGNLSLGLALLLFALAVFLPPITLQRPTFQYMVTFDVTQSMDVEDQRIDGVAVSRLAYARAAMRETLRRLPCGSRVGWSIFADYRVMTLSMPVEVCSSYEELLASLARIDGRMRWANASNIGKGATWVVRTAHAIGPDTRVVFFTDGQESPPLRSASEQPPMQDITAGEIGGWLVGVGGDTAQRIPRTDRDGRSMGFWEAGDVVQRMTPGAPGTSHEHLSELREPHLRGLGELLGLGYLRLRSPEALATAMTSDALARPAPVATDLRWVPALIAWLLLAWRFLPDLRRGRQSVSVVRTPGTAR